MGLQQLQTTGNFSISRSSLANTSHHALGLGLMATKQQPSMVQIPVPTTEDIQQVICRCSEGC